VQIDKFGLAVINLKTGSYLIMNNGKSFPNPKSCKAIFAAMARVSGVG
jgi:hypothetical protein